ncbi:hypothetical protein HK098_007508 [Nowakowskiella sp. JEL0407]|nr:hypothetical protein HK098_007508 [Nowakowskiella sp. JEL0407]
MNVPAGGSIRSPTNSFATGLIKDAWIIAYILYILWLVSLLFSPFWRLKSPKKKSHHVGNGSARETVDESGTDGRETSDTPRAGLAPFTDVNGAQPVHKTETWKTKLANFARAYRDSFLIALGTVTISMAGFGWTTGPLVLFWIVLGLLVLWALTQMLPMEKFGWILDVLLTIGFAVLLIIIWAFAFRQAPSTV